MVRALSVKLTEQRTLSLSMSVNSPYSKPTNPFRWRDGSGSQASFSIPDGECDASRRPVSGWRCGADSDSTSLLWDPLSVITAACLVQSLSLVTGKGNGSDGAGGERRTNRPNRVSFSDFMKHFAPYLCSRFYLVTPSLTQYFKTSRSILRH